MVELTHRGLDFHFAKLDPALRMQLSFVRTLRLPDDGQQYPLPAGLGMFPVVRTEEFSQTIPELWERRHGFMLPIWSSEAMWLQFSSVNFEDREAYRFAVKIAAGQINAVNGENQGEGLERDPQGYVVVPEQPWLDGFSVGENEVRQFVATELGRGATAEEQLTGKARHGGIQIEVIPMKLEAFRERFPVRSYPNSDGEGWLGCDMFSLSDDDGGGLFSDEGDSSLDLFGDGEEPTQMGLGAGGRMVQEIYKDPYRQDSWDLENALTATVYLSNAVRWPHLTGSPAPTKPITEDEYIRAGIPWYDYLGDLPTVQGSETLASLKTVQSMTNPHV